jgi:hypothetical protein
LAHSSRAFSLWLLDHIAFGLWEHSISRQEHVVEEAAPLKVAGKPRERKEKPGSPSRAHP